MSGCALVKRIFTEPPPSPGPVGSIRLPASYAKAAGVALADFFAEEQQSVDALLAAPNPEDPAWKANLALARCLVQPEAYDASVEFDDKRAVYSVTIRPIPEVCLGDQGFALHGGGGKYEIDARAYSIAHKQLME